MSSPPVLFLAHFGAAGRNLFPQKFATQVTNNKQSCSGEVRLWRLHSRVGSNRPWRLVMHVSEATGMVRPHGAPLTLSDLLYLHVIFSCISPCGGLTATVLKADTIAFMIIMFLTFHGIGVQIPIPLSGISASFLSTVHVRFALLHGCRCYILSVLFRDNSFTCCFLLGLELTSGQRCLLIFHSSHVH